MGIESFNDPVFDAKNKDKICVMDWGDWPILPMAKEDTMVPPQKQTCMVEICWTLPPNSSRRISTRA